MLERQNHPFAPYIPQDARALIIGTAPPWNFCTGKAEDLKEGEFAFFFGSIRNLFWYVIKAVFEPDNPRWPRSRLHCEHFLKRHKLGMGDILQSFNRKDRKAADDQLSDFEYNQRLLAKLYRDNQEIRFLYFTSQFACELFLKALKKNKYTYRTRDLDRPNKSFTLNLRYKKTNFVYSCYVLNSPSPRINRSLHEMIEDYGKKFAFMREENTQLF